MNNQNLSEKLLPQDVLEVLTEDVIAVGRIKVVSDPGKTTYPINVG